MRVITLAGSPRYPSRSTALLHHAGKWLEAKGAEVLPWHLHNFPPEDLLNARFDSPALQTLNEQLASADGLLVATPIYKASFSGGLKALLDVLPERALEHKVVLPLSTAGSVAHMLAVDYSLKPVLNALKAQEILQGVFADDSQISHYDRTPIFTDALEARLQDALNIFFQALIRRQPEPFRQSA
ncbi:NADPH-dependent FMN reductase [Dickeya dadantii]|uniref:FMN reductase n=1 Tax=Dickeya dadantii (strain 3937) TaxID=198628 RepID=E0SGV9_DICD3|nr:NADPH-dependent FMN reductase [Dickeya dadantii]ADM98937.1 FMN reductase [Dickeya dadantii 3937]MCA7012864.1 NADPH-dependent FMN reductase [Dickeya dadantii]NAT78073.1 NADPH-dependent FMN reductase [Dickeya dadantii]NPE62288.1 NADPH-dependent FMN reductase [Dickeya dadantii]